MLQLCCLLLNLKNNALASDDMWGSCPHCLQSTGYGSVSLKANKMPEWHENIITDLALLQSTPAPETRWKTRKGRLKIWSDICCYCHPEHAASFQHRCQFIFLSDMGYILQQLGAPSWYQIAERAAVESRAWRPAVWTWSWSATTQPEYWGGGRVFYSAPWLHPTHQADGGPSNGLITRFLFSPLTEAVSFWSFFFFPPHLEVCQDADGLHVFGVTVAAKSICYCSPSRSFNIIIKTSVFCVSKVLLNCTVARLAVGLEGWQCWSVCPPLQPRVKSIGWILKLNFGANI